MAYFTARTSQLVLNSWSYRCSRREDAGGHAAFETAELAGHYSFVPNCMHCVLLGVVGQFVNLWTDSSSHNQPHYIRNIEILDNLLKSIKPPDEVHRLPCTLSDRKYWKASECKNLLSLYSPVVLKSLLPKLHYVHWLLLVMMSDFCYLTRWS